MAKMRKASGLIAAVLLFWIGLGCLKGTAAMRPLGLILIGLGVAGMIWQGRKLAADRRDPYDLSRLWDRDDEPDEPEDDGLDADDGTVFCHNCGHAVPPPLARCPDCGAQLR